MAKQINKKINNKINNKILLFTLVIMMIAMLILANAFQLQVIEGKSNLILASNIARSSQVIRAPRGLIYDTNGQKLVQNDAVFNVYVIPGELDQENLDTLFQTLAQLFNADENLIKEKYEKSGLNSEGLPVGERITLIYDISYKRFLANADDIEDLQGVYISSESKRIYLDSQYMAHVIGYLGDINAQEVEQIGLDGKSQIGKDGLEKVFDKELRGEDGIEISEKSINDDESKSWIPKSYRYGDNVYLTIDLDWQKALYKYLERESVNNNSLGAAAIVMEADSGKIKALVNYPTYDLNLFAQGISQQDFDRLVNDDSSPLLNRVIAMQIPTGSTFKIFMAAALQQEQVINKNSVYKSGCYQLPGDYELCEADKRNYGSLNMISALARSSNPYFCQASVEMARKFGSDELAIRSLDDYFSQFGFGKTTGIDLPGEQPGTIPSPELKLQLQGENWYLADLCNTAIGQGLVAATPLQTARALSAIVNGGIVYKPQIIEKFEDADLKVHEVEKQESNRLAVDKVYLDNIKEGMRQAADYGSASGLNNSPGNPIAKTGSSEATVRTQSGQIISGAHSWAIGSFEHGNKDYVFVVTQQFGGRGYKSVPIARDFIECVHKDFQSCK